jgi:hypothetical protein
MPKRQTPNKPPMLKSEKGHPFHRRIFGQFVIFLAFGVWRLGISAGTTPSWLKY